MGLKMGKKTSEFSGSEYLFVLVAEFIEVPLFKIPLMFKALLMVVNTNCTFKKKKWKECCTMETLFC